MTDHKDLIARLHAESDRQLESGSTKLARLLDEALEVIASTIPTDEVDALYDPRPYRLANGMRSRYEAPPGHRKAVWDPRPEFIQNEDEYYTEEASLARR